MSVALLSLLLGLAAALLRYYLRAERGPREAEYGTIEYVPKKRRAPDAEEKPKRTKRASAAVGSGAPSPHDRGAVDERLIAPHADPALPDGFASALALPIVPTLYAVHAVDSSQAFVVGARGYVARVGEAGVAPLVSGVSATLRAVHGEGDTVVAVGDGGTVLRIDGDVVTPIEAWSTARFGSVHVASKSDVMIGGERVLRGDDRMLSEIPVPSGWGMVQLARRGSEPAWIADARTGRLAIASGGTFIEREPLPATDPVVAIAADVIGGVASIRCDVGEGVFTLQREGRDIVHSIDDPTAIAAHATDDVIVVATEHGEVHWIEDREIERSRAIDDDRFVRLEGISIATDGTVWTAGELGVIERGAIGHLEPVRDADVRSWSHVAVAGGEVWIAGDRQVVRWDGERFVSAYRGPRDEGLQGLAVSARGDVFLGGASRGRGFVHRWHDGRWSRDELAVPVLGLAGRGDAVVAVSGQALLTWSGRSWSERALPELARKPAIGADGTVWALGSARVLRVRDAHVDALDPELGETLYGLWPDGDGVWVAGSNGAIARFDGRRWSRIASPTQAVLFAIGGLEGGPIHAGGHDGTLVKIERDRALAQPLAIDATIFGIAGSREAGLWMVGRGLVVRAHAPGC